MACDIPVHSAAITTVPFRTFCHPQNPVTVTPHFPSNLPPREPQVYFLSPKDLHIPRISCKWNQIIHGPF